MYHQKFKVKKVIYLFLKKYNNWLLKTNYENNIVMQYN